MQVNGYGIEPNANLRSANLYGADLYGANLRSANLYGANLYGANLYGANLYGADLRDADVRSADLRSANLYGANLYGANLPNNSHEICAELLRQAADDNIQRRMLAGLILISRDWCWKHFLSIDHPEKEWALKVLKAAGITDERTNDG
jgi:hypothetical protein